MQSPFDNICIVLCNTSHHGNIGSTARAMKTMNLHNLILVDPIAIPNDHSIALASNAADVVENAKIVATLDEAISDTNIAIAMTSRKRELVNKIQTPKEIVPEIFDKIQKNQKVAIIFGSEKNGLNIEQLEKCNRMVTIPGNPAYFSLNLAQAVQIMCYEIYCNYHPEVPSNILSIKNPATFADNQGVLNHTHQILTNTNFYNNKNQERTLRHIQHIINKSELEREEVDLIRGILKHIEKFI